MQKSIKHRLFWVHGERHSSTAEFTSPDHSCWSTRLRYPRQTITLITVWLKVGTGRVTSSLALCTRDPTEVGSWLGVTLTAFLSNLVRCNLVTVKAELRGFCPSSLLQSSPTVITVPLRCSITACVATVKTICFGKKTELNYAI